MIVDTIGLWLLLGFFYIFIAVIIGCINWDSGYNIYTSVFRGMFFLVLIILRIIIETIKFCWHMPNMVKEIVIEFWRE